MVTERFNPPTRNQLSAVARGDQRLVRAFEQLWKAGGQGIPDEADQIEANRLAIEENAANITFNGDITAENTVRIKSNEVLLWLSM